MNVREKQIVKARQLLSDEQLIAFFRAIRDDENVLAIKLINEKLDEGVSLDNIFYTGDDYGYSLSVRRLSGLRYKISFGCQAGPEAGDGGEWKVKFDGNDVLLIEDIAAWVS